jgi:hypothetical protein
MEWNADTAVRIFAAAQFLVVGLSHVAQPKVWARFFMLLARQGEAGAFANGVLSLYFGSILLALARPDTGPGIVLVVIGAAQIGKASVAFLFPKLSLKGLERVSVERAWEFRVAGPIFIALGGWFAWTLIKSA